MQATIQYIHSELKDIYRKSEIEGFVRLIFDSVLGFSYTDMILQKDKKLDPNEFTKVKAIVGRLKTFEPIQYILGETDFYGLKLKVNSATLIPRHETEELVKWICESSVAAGADILDIGTGSGCIALALKKELKHVAVHGIDISVKALEKAKENARLNELEVDFKYADILRWEELLWDRYELIVSNPPYVRNSEKQFMENNVLNYEPEGALFVEDNDPLIFYRVIAEFALKTLRDNGLLFFEINEYLGEEMQLLLKGLGFRNIEPRKDINGKDRLLKCQK